MRRLDLAGIEPTPSVSSIVAQPKPSRILTALNCFDGLMQLLIDLRKRGP